jgi:hypothetical protein
LSRRPALRIFLGIVVVLAIGIGGYFWYSFHGRATRFLPRVGAPAPILSLLPPESPYVIYANIAALRESAFLSKLAAIVPAPSEDPDYTQFVRDTGFDYTRDLDRVAIAIFQTSPQPLVLIFAEGRFDKQKITAYASRTGTAQQHDGQTVYVMPASTPGDAVSLTFLSDTRIKLVSGPANVDVPAASGQPENVITDRVKAAAGADLFAIARTDSIPANLTIGAIRLDEVASTLKGVRWITLTAVPENEDLRATLQGACDSGTVALKLDMALSGFRFMGRAALSDPSTRKQLTPAGAIALDQLVKQIDISHQDKTVSLSVTLTPEMLSGFAAPAPPAKPAPPKSRPAAGQK